MDGQLGFICQILSFLMFYFDLYDNEFVVLLSLMMSHQLKKSLKSQVCATDYNPS